MSIHQEIKRRRDELGWSQQQLAAEVSRLEGGSKVLSWQTVQQWENGKSAPKRTRMDVVARALGCTVEELLVVPPSATSTAAPPPPPPGYKDRREVSESDWALLQELKLLPDEDRDELMGAIRARAKKYASYLAQRLKAWESKPPPPTLRGAPERESLRPTSDGTPEQGRGERLIPEPKVARRGVK